MNKITFLVFFFVFNACDHFTNNHIIFVSLFHIISVKQSVCVCVFNVSCICVAFKPSDYLVFFFVFLNSCVFVYYICGTLFVYYFMSSVFIFSCNVVLLYIFFFHRFCFFFYIICFFAFSVSLYISMFFFCLYLYYFKLQKGKMYVFLRN